MIRLLLFLLPCAAFAAVPDGRTIAMHGNANGAMPCAACHGVDGRGNSAMGAPALAGLPAGVIEGFLTQFALRDGGVMSKVAKALSADEKNAVAIYFAGLAKD